MKTIFFDVDTQLDFLYPAGALAVPGAENIVENLSKLTRYAAEHSYPIISTADAHSEDDAEFKVWKPHCVRGTTGQQKCTPTLLNQRQTLTTAPDQNLASFREAPQIVVEKQMLDCFTNGNLRPLLSIVGADRYVVYGVVSEYCVRCAALGLLETGARVELVVDAIKSLDEAAERALIDQFCTRGGLATTVSIVLEQVKRG
jgi:nicotinamidase/pyrazinamidase